MIKKFFRRQAPSRRSLFFNTLAAGTGFLFLLMPGLFLPGGTGLAASARPEEEMEVLRMFFEEKDLFSSVTRNPKPVSQIAENITIVTAKEIREMNAHTVAEVLNRVTGLFVNFSQGVGTVGSTSLIQIQGSEDLHVLVLVDGIPWNSMAGGTAETNNIPVGIIERIEIIKGPASSSWGSSLGGVVHIITKSPGYTEGPDGTIRASYGENKTGDYRAEVSGRQDKLGYLLFAGRQQSDGPDKARDFENTSFYSRLAYAFSPRTNLDLSVGYSRPDTGLGDYETIDLASSARVRTFWSAASIEAALSREFTFNLRLFRLEQESTITNRALGLGFTGAKGEPYQQSDYEEATTGGSAKLVWESGIHTAVLGADFQHGSLEQVIDSGRLLQQVGAPARLQTHPDVDKTGIYVNDTLVFDRLSVTPGIRYDDHSITGGFLSPSLGLAYRAARETILRASVARGFTAPPLSWLSGGALFLDPNASLEEERAWSFQAGFETAALEYAWIKGTVFRHEIDDIFSLATGESGRSFVNRGDSRRQGFEIEAETLPYCHASLQAGMAYVNLDPANEFGSEDMYAFNIGITYDNPALFRAELFGHYISWDADAYPELEADAFIWDANISKRVYADEHIGADVFFTVHNLFNESQYLVADNKNPDRWMEAGVRLDF